MPARRDLETILVIGSGPIVIGQACEFDYSGTQAVKALRAEGYRIVLVNSNPATIMTDPELADRTYIEPLHADVLEQIIARERPQALLPTVGGQTALNLACQLWDRGVLQQYGVELIGARREVVEVAEDRLRFKQTMEAAGLPTASAGYVHSVKEAERLVPELGFPVIIRPSFTLGGAGAGIAHSLEELRERVQHGIACSPVGQVLVERSLLGWKEFELEVMRDHKDQVVIICSIENLDPMGVHTGDSITVAPAQTLTDREYQRMRDLALKVIRAVGVETGGSNIQFATNPANGEVVIVEMNPRVSRSSALASKATGFPIAKIAALLAVGYSLDELPNDITRQTPACFEPALDYVVVKIPRWDMDKFPRTSQTLSTSMKSVGEVMAIGRTFREALQKALRSLEIGCAGLLPPGKPRETSDVSPQEPLCPSLTQVSEPTPSRIFQLREALLGGTSIQELYARTRVDPWFLAQLATLVEHEQRLTAQDPMALSREEFLSALQDGFSDQHLAVLWRRTEREVRLQRHALGLSPVYKKVDTCAAEFEAHTPYFYSCWDEECEASPSSQRKIMILGGGPNRIGQGIEFDYCCCHAAFALKELGIEAIMVNCNPETVSTDYDTSDRLYFEPLTLQDVVELVRLEQPEGLIVQLGGQTPLKLSQPLHALGIPILGTAPEHIDLAEDRERFGRLLETLGIPQAPSGLARSEEEAFQVAEHLGFPLLVRPSYVLGGQSMMVVRDPESLQRCLRSAFNASQDRPVLIDRFLDQAIELDIDAVADGDECMIAGILEQIEAAGVHSGDSAAVMPPQTVSEQHLTTIRAHTRALARALEVKGLMNLQVAIQGETVYVLEVNLRASRTVPFVSKATGTAWAKVATRILAGISLAAQGVREPAPLAAVWVKEAVLPFDRFPENDSLLGPEMKSTGEVMGIAPTFGRAYAKACLAAGEAIPVRGTVLGLVTEEEVPRLRGIFQVLQEYGFSLRTLPSQQALVSQEGLTVQVLTIPSCEPRMAGKACVGADVLTGILSEQQITLIICTRETVLDGVDPQVLRMLAGRYGIVCVTHLQAGWAVAEAVKSHRDGWFDVQSLQEWHMRSAGAGIGGLLG